MKTIKKIIDKELTSSITKQDLYWATCFINSVILVCSTIIYVGLYWKNKDIAIFMVILFFILNLIFLISQNILAFYRPKKELNK